MERNRLLSEMELQQTLPVLLADEPDPVGLSFEHEAREQQSSAISEDLVG